MPKEKTPGAYNSKLIPYKQIIFDAWFKERKTGLYIQMMLQEKYSVIVTVNTIYNFIRVRRKKPDPHDLPSFMQIQEQQPKMPNQDASPETAIPVSREKTLAPKQCKGGKPLTKEEQALIDKMMNQTKYEAYEESVRLKMLKKKDQQP